MAVDDQYTISLLHFEDGIKDESGKVWTAQNGAAISTTQSKFGGYSLYCNGSGNISLPTNTYNFAANDFTIDYWVYKTASGSNPSFQNGTPSTPSMEIDLSSSVYMSSNGSRWDIAGGLPIGAEILNSWTHYAVVRKGNNFYAFQNGIQKSTWTSSASIYPAATPMTIGGSGYPGFFTGYIDEFRLSNVARWTSNFTPPTAPYTPGVSVNPPTNLTATAGDSQVTLSWNAVTGATGYNVKRSTTAGGPYTTIATKVADTKYVDATVTNGTTYYYVVTAIDANGNESANSNEASATPMASSKAILQVTMIDSSEREYRVSTEVIDGFINWYTRTIGTGISCYAIDDIVDDSKEYLSFEKIISFKVIPLTK